MKQKRFRYRLNDDKGLDIIKFMEDVKVCSVEISKEENTFILKVNYKEKRYKNNENDWLFEKI